MSDGPLKDADALVWDLRGGWGGAQPQYLDLFNPRAPTMQVKDRNGETGFVDVKWRKPVADADQWRHPQRQGGARLRVQGIPARRTHRRSHRRRGARGDRVPDRRRRPAAARGRGRAGGRPAPRRGRRRRRRSKSRSIRAMRQAAIRSSTARWRCWRARNVALRSSGACSRPRRHWPGRPIWVFLASARFRAEGAGRRRVGLSGIPWIPSCKSWLFNRLCAVEARTIFFRTCRGVRGAATATCGFGARKGRLVMGAD